MVDKEKTIRNVAIARLAKFIEDHFYDTNWTLVAEMCGVIEILNEKKHERVRRAQTFGDDDYALAISRFLREIFDFNENVGISLVNLIVKKEELPDKEKNELRSILKMLASKGTDIENINEDLQIPQLKNLIEISKLPDNFYNKLVEEINSVYREGHAISISILIRKLFENLIIDILRKKYGTKELNLYFNPSKGRFNDFSILLKNFSEKRNDFLYITPNLNDKFFDKINEYREIGNSSAHSIDTNIKISEISKHKDDINYIVEFLLRIFEKI